MSAAIQETRNRLNVWIATDSEDGILAMTEKKNEPLNHPSYSTIRIPFEYTIQDPSISSPDSRFEKRGIKNLSGFEPDRFAVNFVASSVHDLLFQVNDWISKLTRKSGLVFYEFSDFNQLR